MFFVTGTGVEVFDLRTPGTLKRSGTVSPTGIPLGTTVLNGILYVATGSGYLHKYDAATLAPVATYDLTARSLNFQGMDTDGTYLYIGSYDPTNTVFKFDLNGSYVASWTHVYGALRSVAYDEQTGYIYLSNGLTVYVHNGWGGSLVTSYARSFGTSDTMFYYG